VGLLKRLFGWGSDQVADAALVAARNPNAEPIDVTDETFEALIGGASLPALIDFWAPWCGPCRMLAPTIDELAKTYDGRVLVSRMNADENGEAVERLGIQGIPTVVFFKGGLEVGRVVGYVPRHVLSEKTAALL